ncbi:hypothetical protein OXYTRIMIC_363 [Oxytricha trifallax]|uniref:Uncharacterized protein n=1 Tax=Oxytricha trifallax TaxID=1172189 RepID=A0A073HYT8_9SPIT|nr:hypothetical protein OXYTRIMIC_363 [Oxytricha trifallax]
MNKSNFSKNKYEEQVKYERKDKYVNRGRQNKKKEFWEKVQQIRFNHRDRSKDQEALCLRREERVILSSTKQTNGLKNRLKIGKLNPSKKINKSQAQRVAFDKHAYGLECIQGDLIKFKNHRSFRSSMSRV